MGKFGNKGGGNWTRGESRKGNRKGRGALYPPGTPLGRINLVVPMPLYGLMRILGAGNATKGARTAVELASRIMPLEYQDESKVSELLDSTINGPALSRQVTAEAFAKFEHALRSFWDDAEAVSEAVRKNSVIVWPKHKSRPLHGPTPHDEQGDEE
jgi:hypothetical protein